MPKSVDRSTTGEPMTLSFGPQHPATHGTLRIVLELDGETVLKATPHLGYLHTGFEKLVSISTTINTLL
jgi:NADH-quinone oxidoreductase subunit D